MVKYVLKLTYMHTVDIHKESLDTRKSGTPQAIVADFSSDQKWVIMVRLGSSRLFLPKEFNLSGPPPNSI